MNRKIRKIVTGVAVFFSLIAAGRAVEVDDEVVRLARGAFIDRMVSEHNFNREDLAEVLDSASINQGVLEAISRPAERVLTWHEYRQLFLSEARISAAVEFWSVHNEEIQEASANYGVEPELLLAILGIESFFGQRTGSYRVLDSLATLAFAYPPRSSFFTSELEAFFLLIREEGVEPGELLGSYAGAMGAGQFISSSYRAYAVDGDGDGQRDLWGSWQDILGSIANYFKVHGWVEGAPVVDRATRPSSWSGSEPSNSMNLNDTVGSLAEMGYVFSTTLPESSPATMLALDGQDGLEYWVGYHNFRVITRYNRSVKYALAIHQLGQAIRMATESRL